MRKYKKLGGGRYCLCPVEKVPELKTKFVLTYVFEAITSFQHGDLYQGSIRWAGVHKIGKYYNINGIKIGAIDEDIFYG